jgi:hypothetical protein
VCRGGSVSVEREVETKSRDGRREPSARSSPQGGPTEVDLDDESLAFPATAGPMKKALGLPGLTHDAKQKALAR